MFYLEKRACGRRRKREAECKKSRLVATSYFYFVSLSDRMIGRPIHVSPKQSPIGRVFFGGSEGSNNEEEQLSMFMSSQSQKTLMEEEEGDVDFLIDELSDDLFQPASPSDFVPSPIRTPTSAAAEERAWAESMSS